jgi:hypothetical protein
VSRVFLVLAILTLAACNSTAPRGSASPSTAAAPTLTAPGVAAKSLAPSDLDGPCSGRCTPGMHRSVLLQPPLTYTVPVGWFGVEDGTGEYALKFGGADTDDGLFLFRDPVAHSQLPDCPMTADPKVGTSPKELVDWIASLPGLVATPPKAVTVGGLAGFGLEVRVAPSWTHACPYSQGDPVVPLIVGSAPGSDLDWGVGGTGRMRIYLLDAGGGGRIWIDVETIDGGRFDQLAERSTPVIESFVFSAP